MRFLNYVISFLLSLLFHWYLCIPAVILLIFHFVFGISIWWAVGAFILYVVGVRVYMHILGRLVHMGNIKQNENRNVNPHSTGYGDENQ